MSVIDCPFHLVLQLALLHYQLQEVLVQMKPQVVILQNGEKESFLEEALLVMFTSALTGNGDLWNNIWRRDVYCSFGFIYINIVCTKIHCKVFYL